MEVVKKTQIRLEIHNFKNRRIHQNLKPIIKMIGIILSNLIMQMQHKDYQNMLIHKEKI
jgi:hypothetical protein